MQFACFYTITAITQQANNNNFPVSPLVRYSLLPYSIFPSWCHDPSSLAFYWILWVSAKGTRQAFCQEFFQARSQKSGLGLSRNSLTVLFSLIIYDRGRRVQDTMPCPRVFSWLFSNSQHIEIYKKNVGFNASMWVIFRRKILKMW